MDALGQFNDTLIIVKNYSKNMNYYLCLFLLW